MEQGKKLNYALQRKKEGGKKTEKRERGRGSKHLPAAGKFNFDPVDSAVIPKFNL